MTRLLNKNEQSGRSMVEMLGVLAIIGVLSVGGIAGYSKAMTKFKITKTFDQVSMTVANIRTLYSGQRNYSGLATTIALQMGVIPAEMEGSTANTLVNAFQGKVEVGALTYGGNANGAFYISYGNLGREACVSILTSDWGSGSSSGFLAMSRGTVATVGDTAAATPNAVPTADAANTTWISTSLPVTPADAATSCQDLNTVTWFYL